MHLWTVFPQDPTHLPYPCMQCPAIFHVHTLTDSVTYTFQVAFGIDLNQTTWSDEFLGLKHAKCNKLSWLLQHCLRGMMKGAMHPFFKVVTTHSRSSEQGLTITKNVCMNTLQISQSDTTNSLLFIYLFTFVHSIVDSAVKLRATVRQQEPSEKLAGSVFGRGSRPLRMENKCPMISSQVH